MRIQIDSIQGLTDFLMSNWDQLTHRHYCEILEKTLCVYEFDKPKNKDFAIKRIESHYEKIKNLNSELPLFISL